MSRLELVLYALIAVNVLAIGYWLRSIRFRVVVQDATSLRKLARRLPRRLPFPDVAALRPAWNDAIARLKSLFPTPRPKVAAEPAAVANGMKDWIEEIEKSETSSPAPESGSEDWWRSWAASGGVLPRAAGSGRPSAHKAPTP